MSKPDRFDPASLRLTQDFAAHAGVRKVLTTIPVRRPDRQWFVRCHPSSDMRIETAVIDMKEDRETFLVAPELWNELPGEVTPKVLVTSITKSGVLFLWPIRLPGADGRHDQWNQSALEAARMAETSWLRLAANMSLGAYETYVATGDLPDPEWPDKSLSDILKIAFRDRYVDSPEHAVIQRLRGAV